jgi:putative hydrolase of HD superfamily
VIESSDPTRNRQLAFFKEIDAVKLIQRQTVLMDGSRRENDAEHSWHLAIMVWLLAETSGQKLDLARMMQMALIHDIVEIDAGDTFCYDEEGRKTQYARECKAADRIYAILPEQQGSRLRELWDEFEARETPESKFVAAVDRMQPLLHNLCTDGQAWRKHGVKREQVLERNAPIADALPDWWEEIQAWLKPTFDELERENEPES